MRTYERNASAMSASAIARDAFLPHTSRPVDVNLLIALADGVTDAEGEAAVQQVADRYVRPAHRAARMNVLSAIAPE
jgi:hypothetical protein